MALSFQDLESMANEARSQMGALDENAPVDPLKIQIEGITVITLEDIKGIKSSVTTYLLDKASTEWSAMSIPLDPQFETWAIVRNHKHDIERQRVSLLEEFWHIMQGHSLVRIVKVGNNHGRTYDPQEEDEAYYLASATLLPKGAIEKFVNAKNRDLDKFAMKYGVSTQLVEFRIKRLGLWYRYKPKKITVL